MARPKRINSYGEMLRKMENLKKKMEEEKKRMAEVMAAALLSDKSAAILGDCSNAELRRVMVLLSEHIPECAARVKAEKDKDGSEAQTEGTL